MRILGHGVDLVEISRIARMLDQHGDHFISRCFTPRESAYCTASPHLRIQRFAGRWAVKEAVLKALGTGWRDGIAWTDIDVTIDPLGKPGISLAGHAARLAAAARITHWFVSLSHTRDHALGSAIAAASADVVDHDHAPGD